MAIADGQGTTLGRIGEVRRYPVKSMLGEVLEAADVTERGLLGDRAFALIDVETGKVVSAKNPRRWPNLFEFQAAYQDSSNQTDAAPAARITLPDGGTIDTGDPDAESRLSSAVGRSVRLERSANAAPGASGEGYWPDHEWLADRDQTFDFELAPGTFFDGAVLHLLATATLEHMRSLNPASRFDVRRFRPNLLIEMTDGSSGFVENAWLGKTLAIGEVRARVVLPCPRCVMTTLPQQDLPKDPAVLRTAVQGNGGNVGVYAAVIHGGRVGRGDEVRMV
jgi:uncharacterized protein YcbX